MADRVIYRVSHETRYAYSHPVLGCHQLAHLKPRRTACQTLRSHAIVIDPLPRDCSEAEDYFGNRVLRFAIDTPHEALTVRASSIVEVVSQTSAWTDTSIAWENAAVRPVVGQADLDLEVELFRSVSPMVPFLAEAIEYAQASFEPGRPWLQAMIDLTQRIRADFAYDPKATTVTTGVDEVLKNRRGVCQDFAHLMICCVRSLGMPARYVSGYVLNRVPAGATALSGGDASHAWVAGHCPGLGWVAFDPTNGKLADLEFVTLGWGREFSDVTPLRGIVLGSATQELSVAVVVEAEES
jgi:transglutaminase-like putative cysteine protease